MRTLDAVVPIFNEAEILPELHRRLTSVLDSLPLEWRILYVDDGSSDASAGLLAEYASRRSLQVWQRRPRMRWFCSMETCRIPRR